MSESARSVLKHLYKEGRMTEEQYQKIERNLKEMSVEDYRQRLIELFHKTDHDELITWVVMPKEEEFKSLESILRQYKFEPRPHEKWERLKEHITEMRDADGKANQKETCQFILNLMGVIEREGDRNDLHVK